MRIWSSTIHIKVEVVELRQETAIADNLIDLWIALWQPSVELGYSHFIQINFSKTFIFNVQWQESSFLLQAFAPTLQSNRSDGDVKEMR